MPPKTLVSFVGASIARPGHSGPVVKNLSLRINSRDAWVITGPLGSGKTTILDAIRGQIPVGESGSLTYPFLEQKLWPSDVIKILDSRVTATGGSAYYSERYHSRREDKSTLRHWLTKDDDASLAEEGGGMEVVKLARQLDLQDLLDSSTMNLSNGQSKRATIARSLLSRPRVLLLDEPFVGLDVGARENLVRLIGELISRQSGPDIIMALRPLDDVPGWATHILWMNQDGTTRYAGPAQPTLPEYERELATSRDSIKQESERFKTSQKVGGGRLDGSTLVKLVNVNVAYWGNKVLQDVSWTIHAGEKWLLSGSNGSGKTTLLAMILGDHPKIYANEVYLFGKRRGSKDTRPVFELQAEMGHSSPELHKHFPLYRTARACLASAFAEAFHPPPSSSHLTSHQQRLIDDIARYFGVTHDLDRVMSTLSPASQRLFLLMRALVKKPKLVILDEPFAGMDGTMIRRAKRYIDHEITPDQALVFVTHYEDEVPASVTRTIKLDKGHVVELTE